MNCALVTGGAGFIGSHLVQALLELGVTVRVLDNLSGSSPDCINILRNGVKLIQGDVRDLKVCSLACQGVDVIFHMAAQVSVPVSVSDPLLSDTVNTGGTLNMLIAARENGISRFVFSSSAAVYGEVATAPVCETALPLPSSPYGAQKLFGEHYARLFSSLYGLPTVSLRYFNVFGPRQNPQSSYAAAIPKFIDRILSNDTVQVYGDGTQTRDFCYVEDVVQANILAATTSSANAIGGIYNVGSGESTSINSLLACLESLLNHPIPVQYIPKRLGDIEHSLADTRLALSDLNFTARTSLKDGLERTLEYFMNLRSSKR